MKNSVGCGLVLCLFLVFCAGCEQRHEKPFASYSVYNNYKDIPGVTADEIAAIEDLKQNRAQFSLAILPSTEAFARDDGTIGGFGSLFCVWLSDLFGIHFDATILEWDALIQGIEAHELDFTSELTATPERRKRYHMTEAIAERSIKQYRLADAESLQRLAATHTLRYAFLEGAATSQLVSKGTAPHTSVYIKGFGEAASFLHRGLADALLSDSSVEAVFDDSPDIVTEQYFPLTYTRELEVQTLAAQRASRAKGDFLSRMSHEIRTPLNAIIGMAQIVRKVPALPQKAVEANTEILTASDHLLGLLNDILDMAKIESGKFMLVDAPFALSPALHEVAEIISQHCVEKEIDFRTNFRNCLMLAFGETGCA